MYSGWVNQNHSPARVVGPRERLVEKRMVPGISKLAIFAGFMVGLPVRQYPTSAPPQIKPPRTLMDD